MFYVYIIHSSSLNIYYKGFTTNLIIRLEYHNSGMSTYTSKANDWLFVYHRAFETKREALIEEKRLKKLNVSSIKRIISNFNNKE